MLHSEDVLVKLVVGVVVRTVGDIVVNDDGSLSDTVHRNSYVLAWVVADRKRYTRADHPASHLSSTS